LWGNIGDLLHEFTMHCFNRLVVLSFNLLVFVPMIELHTTPHASPFSLETILAPNVGPLDCGRKKRKCLVDAVGLLLYPKGMLSNHPPSTVVTV
jgi:hypothetical protein